MHFTQIFLSVHAACEERGRQWRLRREYPYFYVGL